MSPSPLPFFFNTPATTQIYTLSLHDALPIYDSRLRQRVGDVVRPPLRRADVADVHDVPAVTTDRKSTRLNSSHQIISYAVFCLKKKTHLDHFPLAQVCVSSAIRALPYACSTT